MKGGIVSGPGTEIIPSGTHKGKRLREISNESLNAMVSGWNGCSRRNHPFFPKLVAEQQRRDCAGVRVDAEFVEKKQEPKRRSIRDDFALALLPILCGLEIDADDETDPTDPVELERLVREAYEKADFCLRVREEIGGGE